MASSKKKNQFKKNGIEMYQLLKESESGILWRWTGNYFCLNPMSDTFAIGDTPQEPYIEEVMYKQMLNAKVIAQHGPYQYKIITEIVRP